MNKRAITGFTLLQLLVVIAIISILTLLLSTALNAGIERAQAARCISNLRQIGIAILAYAAEHNSSIPARIEYKDVPPYDHDPQGYWHMRLEPYLPPKGDSKSNVFLCPAFPFVDGAPDPYQSYGYRVWRLPGTPDSELDRSKRLSSIPNLSDFFLVTDSYVTYFKSQGYFVSTGDATWRIHLRHPHKTANALMADGHVAAKGQDYFDRVATEQSAFNAQPAAPFYFELRKRPDR